MIVYACADCGKFFYYLYGDDVTDIVKNYFNARPIVEYYDLVFEAANAKTAFIQEISNDIDTLVAGFSDGAFDNDALAAFVEKNVKTADWLHNLYETVQGKKAVYEDLESANPGIDRKDIPGYTEAVIDYEYDNLTYYTYEVIFDIFYNYEAEGETPEELKTNIVAYKNDTCAGALEDFNEEIEENLEYYDMCVIQASCTSDTFVKTPTATCSAAGTLNASCFCPRCGALLVLDINSAIVKAYDMTAYIEQDEENNFYIAAPEMFLYSIPDYIDWVIDMYMSYGLTAEDAEIELAEEKDPVDAAIAGAYEFAAADLETDGYYGFAAHDYNTEAFETKASTCKTAGYDRYKCNNCDDVKEVARALDPANHEGETEIRGETDSTCKAAGYTGDTYCLGCNAKIASGSAKELAAHTPKAAVKENEVASTCKAAGSYDEVVYCAVCDAEISREAKTLELAGHHYVDYVCTECGAVDPNKPADEPEQPPQQPDEPEQKGGFVEAIKGIYQKVVVFFNRIVDFFKNLFKK